MSRSRISVVQGWAQAVGPIRKLIESLVALRAGLPLRYSEVLVPTLVPRVRARVQAGARAPWLHDRPHAGPFRQRRSSSASSLRDLLETPERGRWSRSPAHHSNTSQTHLAKLLARSAHGARSHGRRLPPRTTRAASLCRPRPRGSDRSSPRLPGRGFGGAGESSSIKWSILCPRDLGRNIGDGGDGVMRATRGPRRAATGRRTAPRRGGAGRVGANEQDAARSRRAGFDSSAKRAGDAAHPSCLARRRSPRPAGTRTRTSATPPSRWPAHAWPNWMTETSFMQEHPPNKNNKAPPQPNLKPPICKGGFCELPIGTSARVGATWYPNAIHTIL